VLCSIKGFQSGLKGFQSGLKVPCNSQGHGVVFKVQCNIETWPYSNAHVLLYDMASDTKPHVLVRSSLVERIYNHYTLDKSLITMKLIQIDDY